MDKVHIYLQFTALIETLGITKSKHIFECGSRPVNNELRHEDGWTMIIKVLAFHRYMLHAMCKYDHIEKKY